MILATVTLGLVLVIVVMMTTDSDDNGDNKNWGCNNDYYDCDDNDKEDHVDAD